MDAEGLQEEVGEVRVAEVPGDAATIESDQPVPLNPQAENDEDIVPIQQGGLVQAGNVQTVVGVTTVADELALPSEASTFPPSYQLDVINSGASSQFAMLVRGWETYVNHSARNVQLGLQNLNRCGDGLVGLSIGDDENDLWAPIGLRYTHSSPLNYSSIFDDPPPATGLDNVRRSSSTPSSSVFRQRSAGSAFVANLRTMPNLSGPDDRSAFTLPMQRPSYSSMSDSGARFSSAFNPINFQGKFDEIDKTSIEVMDMGPTQVQQTEAPRKWFAASKAKKFLKDNMLLRGRRRAQYRPAATATIDDASTVLDNDNQAKQPSCREVQVIASVQSSEEEEASIIDTDNTVFPILRQEEEDITISPNDCSRYQNLDSDVDEEYAHYQRIETIHESPGTVPSPVYQPFHDRGETPPATGVRVQVSSRTPIQHFPTALLSRIESPEIAIGRSVSHDSGSESPGTAISALTSNTSGHATLGTSASGTVSSGRLTILSTVSETDREVMETNKAGRGMRLQKVLESRHAREQGDDATVPSSSTTSTSITGYLALNSPGPLRDGASLVTDRFFKATTIPVYHSSSINSDSTNSVPSSSGTSTNSETKINPAGTESVQRIDSHLTCNSTIGHGETTASVSNTTTSSGSSQSEDPPTFVSYLERQLSIQAAKTIVRGDTRSSPPILVRARRDSSAGRESSAQLIESSSQVVFEAAKPDSKVVFRPLKTRDRKQKAVSRPPLSPIKGLRTPPPYHRTFSTSPAQQHLSPPNIVDHCVESTEVSKPFVLRSGPPVTGIALITPERSGATHPSLPLADCDSSWAMEPNMGRSRTYRETSIEVEKDESGKENPTLSVVSPEGSTSRL